MAYRETDYTSSVTPKEKVLLNVFKQTLSNSNKVNSVFKDLIANKTDKDEDDPFAKVLTTSALIELLTPEKLMEIINNSHARNYDNKLEGLETLILKCNSSVATKLVSFYYKDKEVAYLDITGKFHGGFAQYTEEEILNMLKNSVTSTDLENILSGYIRKSDLFDMTTNTIKNDLISKELFTKNNETLIETIEDIVEEAPSMKWSSF